jgi:enoyl-CoA hydratase
LTSLRQGRRGAEISTFFEIEDRENCSLLRLVSEDGTNRLSRSCVAAVTNAVGLLARSARPLIITGNQKFFSAGADLNEIAALGSDAFEFAKMGQRLMQVVDEFPARVCAAVYGYCMGGGLDLALACDYRIAHPHAVFGHRGAALGLITGWGGTQRLPRLVGRAKALEMFAAAEKVPANRAVEIGLVGEVSDDPVEAAVKKCKILRLKADSWG